MKVYWTTSPHPIYLSFSICCAFKSYLLLKYGLGFCMLLYTVVIYQYMYFDEWVSISHYMAILIFVHQALDSTARNQRNFWHMLGKKRSRTMWRISLTIYAREQGTTSLCTKQTVIYLKSFGFDLFSARKGKCDYVFVLNRVVCKHQGRWWQLVGTLYFCGDGGMRRGFPCHSRRGGAPPESFWKCTFIWLKNLSKNHWHSL